MPLHLLYILPSSFHMPQQVTYVTALHILSFVVTYSKFQSMGKCSPSCPALPIISVDPPYRYLSLSLALCLSLSVSIIPPLSLCLAPNCYPQLAPMCANLWSKVFVLLDCFFVILEGESINRFD